MLQFIKNPSKSLPKIFCNFLSQVKIACDNRPPLKLHEWTSQREPCYRSLSVMCNLHIKKRLCNRRLFFQIEKHAEDRNRDRAKFSALAKKVIRIFMFSLRCLFFQLESVLNEFRDHETFVEEKSASFSSKQSKNATEFCENLKDSCGALTSSFERVEQQNEQILQVYFRTFRVIRQACFWITYTKGD